MILDMNLLYVGRRSPQVSHLLNSPAARMTFHLQHIQFLYLDLSVKSLPQAVRTKHLSVTVPCNSAGNFNPTPATKSPVQRKFSSFAPVKVCAIIAYNSG